LYRRTLGHFEKITLNPIIQNVQDNRQNRNTRYLHPIRHTDLGLKDDHKRGLFDLKRIVDLTKLNKYMRPFLTTICMLLMINSFAQDTIKVEQYCEVVATGRLLSAKVTIDIDYGEERSIWKDNRLKNENGKLIKFNSVIDALNFLGGNGWKLVNAFPISSTNEPTVYHYVFKKEFPAAETRRN
jgi:hypothetical protein